jgi:hypothetical protein
VLERTARGSGDWYWKRVRRDGTTREMDDVMLQSLEAPVELPCCGFVYGGSMSIYGIHFSWCERWLPGDIRGRAP